MNIYKVESSSSNFNLKLNQLSLINSSRTTSLEELEVTAGEGTTISTDGIIVTEKINIGTENNQFNFVEKENTTQSIVLDCNEINTTDLFEPFAQLTQPDGIAPIRESMNNGLLSIPLNSVPKEESPSNLSICYSTTIDSVAGIGLCDPMVAKIKGD